MGVTDRANPSDATPGAHGMRAVHHVGITVRDLDRSVAFYHEVLGLDFVVPPTPWFRGDQLAQALGVEPPVALRVALFEVARGGTWFEVLEYGSPPSATDRPLRQNDIGAAHVAFHVDDIVETYERLRDRGVPFHSAPNVVDEGPLAGWRWVYFDDPDGHMMELVEVAYVHQEERDEDVARFLRERFGAKSDDEGGRRG